jgi:D-alanyl-lipoteichoic acid acyltransferase DltB (MBOAT superfamily)
MGKATIYTAAAATLIAMGIAGFWHGPAWKFVIFGLLHGVALAINQAWKKQKRRLPDWLGWSVTMALVNVAFVFFRSTDVGFATHFVAAMLPRLNLVGTGALRGAGVTLIFPQIVIGAIVSVYFKTSQETATTLRLSRMAALATAALMLVCWYFMDASVTKQFVYAGF